jgi:hypothetical protein
MHLQFLPQKSHRSQYDGSQTLQNRSVNRTEFYPSNLRVPFSTSCRITPRMPILRRGGEEVENRALPFAATTCKWHGKSSVRKSLFHLKRPSINQGSNRSSFAVALSSGCQHNIRRRKRRNSSFSSPCSLSSRVSRL